MLLPLLAPLAQAGSISTAGIMAGPDSGAATANVAAGVLNPAALGGLTGPSFLFDTQATFVRLEVTASRNDGIDPNTGEAYKPATARATVPNAVIGFAMPIIKDRLVMGLTANDPFVGGGDYTSTETGTTPPYTSHTRYHIIDTATITAAITPSLAVKVLEGVHLGGGVSYVYDILNVLQASDPYGTEGVQPGAKDPAPYSTDTLLQGDLTGSHWAWMVGAYVDAIEGVTLGASYAAPATFNASGDGSVTVPASLTLENEDLTVPAKVGVTYPLPAIIRANANVDLNDKLMLGAGFDWQLWNNCCGGEDGDISIEVTNADGEGIGPDDGLAISVNPQQYNPRRLWNSVSVGVYGGYQVNEELWLGARTGFNQNAVPDYAVNPSNLDFVSIPAMVGARYRVGKTTLGLAYSKFFLMEREITDSAWNLQDGNDRFSPSLPYKTNANGTYGGLADSVGIRVGVDL